MSETGTDTAPLTCRVLSCYINVDWKGITFEALTDDHVIYNNGVLEEKKSRVKLVYKYGDLQSLQTEVFDKFALLTKNATFAVDPKSQTVVRKDDGYTYHKYTIKSAPTTS